MIISFTIRNYKSLKEEVTLHFGVDNLDGVHSGNIAYPDGAGKLPVLRVAGIWGANASGKSNILGALADLCSFVSRSQRNELDAGISEYHPFRLDAASASAPVYFELDFISGNHRHFIYTVEISAKRVEREALEYYGSAKPTMLFQRKWEDGKSQFKFSQRLTGVKNIGVLENQAYLSVAGNTAGISDVIRDAYRAMRDEINFLNPRTRPMVNKQLRESGYVSALGTLLACADTGIGKVTCHEEKISPGKFPSGMQVELKEHLAREFGITPRFQHNGAAEEFDLRDESDGTARLYDLAPYILLGISSSDVFVIDELDCQLHPKLVEMLLTLFQDSRVNGKHPQLLFTAHDTMFLNPDLLRRDQIWFTQKNHAGITELTCLDEYDSVRADTNFEKWYREERFDAVPSLNYSQLLQAIQAVKTLSDEEK